MQGSDIVTKDIFEFVQTGLDDDKIQGEFTPTGYIPSFFKRMKDTLPEDFFEQP